MQLSKFLSAAFGAVLLATSAAWASGGDAIDGTIDGIDKTAKKLTISHGPIKSLGMGPMTMDFSVVDPAMLTEVKKGQKIKFYAIKDKQGNFVVTDLE